MHDGGLAYLWRPLRIDPALDREAQAPHPAQEGQLFPIGMRARIHDGRALRRKRAGDVELAVGR
jgi:hypothetical protein